MSTNYNVLNYLDRMAINPPSPIEDILDINNINSYNKYSVLGEQFI